LTRSTGTDLLGCSDTMSPDKKALDELRIDRPNTP